MTKYHQVMTPELVGSRPITAFTEADYGLSPDVSSYYVSQQMVFHTAGIWMLSLLCELYDAWSDWTSGWRRMHKVGTWRASVGYGW